VNDDAQPTQDTASRSEPQDPATPSPSGPATGLAGLAADFAAMVRFYSRLPLPRLGAADDPAAPPPFGRAIRMLPFAGLAIAAGPAALLAALAPSALPSLAVAALTLATLAYLTGAFHEDGIADVADGFGGGFTAERRLQIMKDSRIGAFAGVALAVQFVLRASLLAEAIDRFDGLGAGLVVLGVAVMARVAPLGLMVALDPARADGLGRAAGRPEPTAFGFAVAGAVAIVVLTMAPIVGASLVPAIVVAVAAVAGLGLLARVRIGGFTGDVVGAGTIVAEIAAMIGLLA
jgi:adenosylcobinamide-GDP ribazoletransferase